MFHFHRWEIVSKRTAEATFTGVIYGCRETVEDVVVVVEKCTKCNKRRAYMKSIDGLTQSIDLDFLVCTR